MKEEHIQFFDEIEKSIKNTNDALFIDSINTDSENSMRTKVGYIKGLNRAREIFTRLFVAELKD